MRFTELVELTSEVSKFDQPCKYGNRTEGSVYCHNEKWKDAPRNGFGEVKRGAKIKTAQVLNRTLTIKNLSHNSKLENL